MGLQHRSIRLLAAGAGVLALAMAARQPAGAQAFVQTNLITDDQSVNAAQITDTDLVNAWGMSFSPSGSPIWVSDNGKGVSTLYVVNPVTNVTSKAGLVVTIPSSLVGNPTGQAFNTISASGAFNSDNFLFVSEDGTISGWRGVLGTTAEVLQLSSTDNVYKGAALDVTGGHGYLLSANFRTGNIDVLKGDAGAPDLAGKFTDPGLPSGYAPFDVQVLNGKVYVTYALQDGAKHDDVPGPGHGFVSVFNLDGSFLGRVGTDGALNSPWGLAIAPSTFGAFAGDLLVGNFGDGRINAFNLATNTFAGQLHAPGGSALSIDGLWGITPGNDGNGGSSSKLYFSAGPGEERHGLFGVLTATAGNSGAVPEPGSLALLSAGMMPFLMVLYRRRAARLG